MSLPDGSIQFITRGLPPTEVPGYEVDEGDIYLFHPILTPCQARIFKQMNDSSCCPTGRKVRHCTKFGYYSMPASTCKACEKQGLHVPVVLGLK